jgi:flagellar biosynthesis protein FlhG
VINKARDESDYYLGEAIVKAVQKYLVINLNYLGAIPHDNKVHYSVKNMIPFLHKFSDSDVGRSFHSITEKLIKPHEI